MISFSEFLTEARMAPLYHGTSLKRLKSILFSGGFEPRTVHSPRKLLKVAANAKGEDVPYERDSYIGGLSLTRSLSFAKNWSFKSADMTDRENAMVVLQFDQQRLSQRYEIKPIQYWTAIIDGKIRGSGRYTENPSFKSPFNEYEEFVIFKKLLPFSYVTKIFIDKKHIDTVKELLDRYKFKAEAVEF